MNYANTEWVLQQIRERADYLLDIGKPGHANRIWDLYSSVEDGDITALLEMMAQDQWLAQTLIEKFREDT